MERKLDRLCILNVIGVKNINKRASKRKSSALFAQFVARTERRRLFYVTSFDVHEIFVFFLFL